MKETITLEGSPEAIRHMKAKIRDIQAEEENWRRITERRIALLEIKDQLAKDLKPCPFCGGEMRTFPGVMIFEESWRGMSTSHYIRCIHCSAQGPSVATLEWAAAAWNGRTPYGQRYKDWAESLGGKQGR